MNLKDIGSFVLRGTLITALAVSTSACVTLAVGAIAVTSIDIALDRRTIGEYVDDNALEVKLRTQIRLDESLGTGVNISVTSMNGIVLLTGEVYSDAQRQRAEALAKSYEETRQVVNELDLAGKTGLPSRANDSYITGKVKTELFVTKNLSSSAIKVVTERGKVYLMGLVTRQEADLAVEAAQSVSGVTHIVKVFEYIK